jgi:hypothetical protein
MIIDLDAIERYVGDIITNIPKTVSADILALCAHVRVLETDRTTNIALAKINDFNIKVSTDE